MRLSSSEFLKKCMTIEFQDIGNMYLELETRIGEIQHKDTEYDTYNIRMVRLHPQRKIPQIKYHRECTGMGLKESKDIIDASHRFLGFTINENLKRDNAISYIRNYLDSIQQDDVFISGLPFEIEVDIIVGLAYGHTIPKNSNGLVDMLIQVKRNGFIKVYEEEFLYGDNDNITIEQFFIYFQPNEGILVKFDSYWDRTTVNSADMYYNWKPNDIKTSFRCVSSGGFVNTNPKDFNDPPNNQLIWGGYHDVRDSFEYKLNELRENGAFISPSVGMNLYPFLTTFGDKDDNGKVDYYSKTEERLKKMPYFVFELTSYEKINKRRLEMEDKWQKNREEPGS